MLAAARRARHGYGRLAARGAGLRARSGTGTAGFRSGNAGRSHIAISRPGEAAGQGAQIQKRSSGTPSATKLTEARIAAGFCSSVLIGCGAHINRSAPAHVPRVLRGLVVCMPSWLSIHVCRFPLSGGFRRYMVRSVVTPGSLTSTSSGVKGRPGEVSIGSEGEFMANGDLTNANPLVRRLLDEISKLEGAMPEACKAIGVSPEDIARLANGQRISGEALEAIREWLDQRVGLSRQEQDDYDRLRAAAKQTLAVVLSNPTVSKSISTAIAKASPRELIAYAVAAFAVVLLVGVTIGVVVARPGSAAPNAASETLSSAAPPSPPSSTEEGAASPTPAHAGTTSPTAASSAPPSATAPTTGGVQAVYQDVTLHIPAMGPNESAGVTLAPPAEVTLNPGAGSDDDLEYFNSEGVGDNTSTQSWYLGSGDRLADMGTQSPSPTACKQLITTDPADLSTQNLEQGQGYCIQIADGGIGYFRILSMAQGDGNGDSGAVALTLTLWQS